MDLRLSNDYDFLPYLPDWWLHMNVYFTIEP